MRIFVDLIILSQLFYISILSRFLQLFNATVYPYQSLKRFYIVFSQFIIDN